MGGGGETRGHGPNMGLLSVDLQWIFKEGKGTDEISFIHYKGWFERKKGRSGG